MHDSVFSIRQLLKAELDRCRNASDIPLTPDELFDRAKLRPWIDALVGRSVSGKLAECITKTSDERLSHAAAAYLLGMALRSRLGLRFDRLPRIMAHTASDGFHFFWAIICLTHDLGYRFENDSPTDPDILRKMKTARGRMELLGIEHNLFEVDRAELFALGIDPDNEIGQWILESVELAKKYDRYRRQTDHSGDRPVADHGICGALLLYDILRTECEQLQLRRRRRRFDHHKRHADQEPLGNLDGAVKDSSPTRFIRCGLLIACTVARHNMWLASKDADKALYQRYGLEALFADRPNVKIRADFSMEQMLFFLDFVDTIDPAKWFYLRDVEYGPAKGECDRSYGARLAQQYAFMMDRVWISFDVPAAETERRFSLLAVTEDCGERKLFERFCHSTASLTDWLDAPDPVIGKDRITYVLPFVPGERTAWPAGITEEEVNSLLLYMGCGVPGMYGAFYSSTRAYQTLNLLMMDGSAGEKVRVCLEKQKPNGVFLREWEQSVAVMTDIFRAQCKYARDPETPIRKDVLFRSDRRTNFRMMQTHGATYAMTSTSRGSYLEDFLVDKVDPHILRIELQGDVPCFDYEGFFGDEYIFADEREVLLPPMLPMEARWRTDFVLPDPATDGTTGKVVRWYDVTFGGFDLQKTASPAIADPEQFLNTHAQEAAAALDKLAETRDMTAAGLSDPNHVYWDWKRCYQYLLRGKLQEIYREAFLVCST